MHVWMPLIRTGTGAEVYMRVLADRLRKRGHRVTLSEAAHVFQYAPWLAPLHPPRDADLVLANSWNAAAFRRSSPLVTIVHHVVHAPALAEHNTFAQSLFHRWFVKPMECAAIRQSALVIAVSGTTERAIRKYLGNTAIRTVPNGVDVDFFTPGDRQITRDSKRPFELLFVGKPSRRKGFDMVAKIVTHLGDECRFTCIGPHPEPGIALPPGNFLGRVSSERLREAYRAADLLLMPSRLEGFGYAAAEAMACGVPVTACSGTAVADLIPEGGGVIKEPGDIDGFVGAIRMLMNDLPRRVTLRAHLRNHAVENLSEGRWVVAMEDALESAIRK